MSWRRLRFSCPSSGGATVAVFVLLDAIPEAGDLVIDVPRAVSSDVTRFASPRKRVESSISPTLGTHYDPRLGSLLRTAPHPPGSLAVLGGLLKRLSVANSAGAQDFAEWLVESTPGFRRHVPGHRAAPTLGRALFEDGITLRSKHCLSGRALRRDSAAESVMLFVSGLASLWLTGPVAEFL